MQQPTHIITYIDDDGEAQTQAYDPANPQMRAVLEQNAADCPICEAMLRGEDPFGAAPVNRADRRRLARFVRRRRDR